jgi:DNA-binding NtrC family response regulator
MSKKILLVDDSRPMLDALSQLLKGQGYEVHTAEDWYVACKLAHENQGYYDLIVSDNQLGENPQHWGVNLLPILTRKLQNQAKTILISTEPVEDHPADAFVLKTQAGELLDTVRKLLN